MASWVGFGKLRAEHGASPLSQMFNNTSDGPELPSIVSGRCMARLAEDLHNMALDQAPWTAPIGIGILHQNPQRYQ